MPKRITDLTLDRNRVSRAAVAVIDALRGAGFDAYLVGGCVRDLLLGRAPKDFDVASSATPEEVREVLPRVRLVGRRFRIAHVRVKREIIEVSTFRRAAEHADEALRPVLSSQGIILRDNSYGAIDEDAFRRDFTINALYYDPVDHVLFDYCNGLADIERRTLRLIGDPEQRFREDPVRILRAARFAAKLDLQLHPATERAIAPTAPILAAIPPARLFDEFGKLFLSGDGERAFDILQQHGLTEYLFPLADDGGTLARLALANTDKRLREDKPVTPGFLLAAFLWHEFARRAPAADLGAQRCNDEDLDNAAIAVIAEQQSTIAIPRRHGYFIREVWRLQPRLHQRTAQNVAQLLEHRRFRAAYDFLVLRSVMDDRLKELANWWTDVQTEDADELKARLPSDRPRRRRRRRYARRSSRDVGGLAASSGAVAAP